MKGRTIAELSTKVDNPPRLHSVVAKKARKVTQGPMTSCVASPHEQIRFGLLLRLADRRVTEIINEHLFPLGLTAEHFRLLAFIEYSNGRVPQRILSEHMMYSGEDELLQVIAILRLRNFITREIDDDDVYLEITSLGNTLLRAAKYLVEDARSEVIKIIGSRDFDVAMSALHKMAGVYEPKDMEVLEFRKRNGTE